MSDLASAVNGALDVVGGAWGDGADDLAGRARRDRTEREGPDDMPGRDEGGAMSNLSSAVHGALGVVGDTLGIGVEGLIRQAREVDDVVCGAPRVEEGREDGPSEESGGGGGAEDGDAEGGSDGPSGNPVSDLLSSVNGALDVMSNALGNGMGSLIEQAHGFAENIQEDQRAKEGRGDEPNDAAESDSAEDRDGNREPDGHESPTELFALIRQRAWTLALARLRSHPAEARAWIHRRAPGGDRRLGLLPLHAAIVLGAPRSLVAALVDAHPGAATEKDARGSLPVHLAAARLDADEDGDGTVLRLFGAYPASVEAKDEKGRTPLDLALLARASEDGEEQSHTTGAMGTSQDTRSAKESTAEGQGTARADDGEEEHRRDDRGEDDASSVRSGLSGRFRRIALSRARSSNTVERRMAKGLRRGRARLSPAKSIETSDLPRTSTAPGLPWPLPSCDEGSVQCASSAAPPDDAIGARLSISHSLREWLSLSRTESRDSTCGPGTAGGDGRHPAATAAPPPPAAAREELEGAGPRPETAPVTATREGPWGLPVPAYKFGREYHISEDAPPAVPGVHVLGLPLPESSDESLRSASSSRSESHPAGERPGVSRAARGHGSPGTSATPSAGGREVNQGMLVRLQQAAENVGRGDLNMTPFVETLEDEWVAGVEALRSLDGHALERLLPIVLSQELQRLMRRADDGSGDGSITEREDKPLLPDGGGGGGDGDAYERSGAQKKSGTTKEKKQSHRPSNRNGLVPSPECVSTDINKAKEESEFALPKRLNQDDMEDKTFLFDRRVREHRDDVTATSLSQDPSQDLEMREQLCPDAGP